MTQLQWKELTPTARKWVRGWVAIMKKDMSQHIVHSNDFDDSMILYFTLPQCLTREQFEMTDAPKEVKVDWENHGFKI